MVNIYLTDSDEEAIVDFVKDHTELYETSTLREADTIEVWTAPKEMMEHQTSATTAHNISRSSNDTDSMEISSGQQTPHYRLNKS